MPRPASLCLAAVTLTSLFACSGGTGAPGTSTSNPTTPAEQAAEVSSFVEGKDYTILERVRFMDEQGFERPAEAFSVLVPRGWTHEGGIVWKGLQACEAERVSARWTVVSPDGAVRFTSLPYHAWTSASDPLMMDTLRAMAQAGGCALGGPMSAEQHLREVLLGTELNGATIIDVRENAEVAGDLELSANKLKDALAQMGGRADVQASAVVARLTWADGTEGIALVSVLNVTNNVPNTYTGQWQQLFSGMATERSYLRFPPERKEEAERVVTTLKSSYRTNPDWKAAIDQYNAQVRSSRDQAHHQKMAAIDAQTRANTAAHNQRMADIQAQGDANTARHNERMATMDSSMRSWEAQQNSQDRTHTRFVQTIREVETYQEAGGTVELSGGYDQAWSRGDGSYLLSNTPGFDPAAALQDQRWEEMKRVDR